MIFSRNCNSNTQEVGTKNEYWPGSQAEIWLTSMQNMMNKKQAKRISDELHRQGGPAEQALRIRCEQEKKVRLDVIMECGDPRKWKN